MVSTRHDESCQIEGEFARHSSLMNEKGDEFFFTLLLLFWLYHYYVRRPWRERIAVRVCVMRGRESKNATVIVKRFPVGTDRKEISNGKNLFLSMSTWRIFVLVSYLKTSQSTNSMIIFRYSYGMIKRSCLLVIYKAPMLQKCTQSLR